MSTDNPLANLPSRGCLTAVGSPAVLSAPVPYIAVHDTRPPPGQVVRTDETSLLIRALTVSSSARARGGASEVGAKRKGKSRAGAAGAGASGSADADAGPAAKRSRAASGSGRNRGANDGEAGPSGAPGGDGERSAHDSEGWTRERLMAKTIKQLTELLRAKSLPTKGNKDELVKRLLNAQEHDKKR